MLFNSANRKRIDIVFRAVSVFQRASRAARHAWCFARISSAVRPRVTATPTAAFAASEGSFSRATSRTPSGPFASESERRAGTAPAGMSNLLEAPVPSSKISAEAYAVSSRVERERLRTRRRPRAPSRVSGRRRRDPFRETNRNASSGLAVRGGRASRRGNPARNPRRGGARSARRRRPSAGGHDGRRDDERDVLRREARRGGEEVRRGADVGGIEIDECGLAE